MDGNLQGKDGTADGSKDTCNLHATVAVCRVAWRFGDVSFSLRCGSGESTMTVASLTRRPREGQFDLSFSRDTFSFSVIGDEPGNRGSRTILRVWVKGLINHGLTVQGWSTLT